MHVDSIILSPLIVQADHTLRTDAMNQAASISMLLLCRHQTSKKNQTSLKTGLENFQACNLSATNIQMYSAIRIDVNLFSSPGNPSPRCPFNTSFKFLGLPFTVCNMNIQFPNVHVLAKLLISTGIIEQSLIRSFIHTQHRRMYCISITTCLFYYRHTVYRQH